MTRIAMALLSALVFLGAVPSATAGVGADRQIIEFHGIRDSDPTGSEGIANPERGFRYEARIADSNDQAWAARAKGEAGGTLTLVQCYCYLPEFVGKDISAQKLEQLQSSFETLHRLGMKAVLRFAYESTPGGSVGPTLDDIRRHIAQLRPLLVKNVGVIDVLQAGMVGLWGEWHHSVHGLDRDVEAQKIIVEDLLDALPKSRMIQLRRASYKRAILGESAVISEATAHDGSPVARIGFHQDYFVVRRNSWDTSPGTRDFDQVSRESPYVMVDGEMPWGNEADDIDGIGAIERLRIHHYTSFSIVHNYREGGHNHSFVQWQNTPLTADQMRARNLPIDEGYFEDQQGHPISRSVFEYVRDHLGYRIELQRADLPRVVRATDRLQISVTLINRGFSAPQNPRNVYLVLIGGDGSTIQLPTDADPRRWQPYQPGDAHFEPLNHEIQASTMGGITSLRPGRYQIGLWLPDSDPALHLDSHYAIRCSNRDSAWWVGPGGSYGVNLLGTIEVRQ